MTLPSGRLSHAYIIESVSADRRSAAARELAAAMLCQSGGSSPCRTCRDCRKVFSGLHPDIIPVERELDTKGNLRREIYVDQIRAIIADSVILPNEAARKVYLIREAELMNGAAQNTLLKLLEEPPGHVSLILCAPNAGTLLDTVRSRCVELSSNDDADACAGESTLLAKEYLRVLELEDRAELFLFCCAGGKLSHEQMGGFIAAAQALVVDVLCRRQSSTLSREKLLAVSRLLQRAEEYLSANVNVKHIFGMLGASG